MNNFLQLGKSTKRFGILKALYTLHQILYMIDALCNNASQILFVIITLQKALALEKRKPKASCAH